MKHTKMTDDERRARNKLIQECQLLETELMQSRSPKRRAEIKKRVDELNKVIDETR